MKGISWLNVLVGIWLLFSPALLSFGEGAVAGNNVILGIIVIAVSAWSLAESPTNHLPARINLIIGVWMFVSAWVLGYDLAVGLWNGLIVGALLVIFSLIRMSAPQVPGRV